MSIIEIPRGIIVIILFIYVFYIIYTCEKKRNQNKSKKKDREYKRIDLLIDDYDKFKMTCYIKNNNGNLFYLRWGDGPNNSLVINTGTLIDENDIYDINNLFYTNINWLSTKFLNQFIFKRDKINKNSCNIFIPPDTYNIFNYILDNMYISNNSINKHNIFETFVKDKEKNSFSSPYHKNEVILGDKKNIKVEPFTTYSSKGIGYLIQIKINNHWNNLAAFTGKTTINVFHDEDNYFLKNVPYLFIDIGFIDKSKSFYEAYIKETLHLKEIINLNLNNKSIIGYNLSEHYTINQIESNCKDFIKKGNFIIYNQ